MREKAAINALAMMRRDLRSILFFDHHPQRHGTPVPGIPNPIESRQSLVKKPAERILIFSNSFSGNIAHDPGGATPARTVIHTWNDTFKDRKDGQECLKQE